MADSLSRKATVGVVWSAIDRVSAQGLAFIFNILIARLLLPSDYGVIAMLEVFLAISQTFIDSGFASALIRKHDRTDVDCSTVFYFNIVISVLAYVILWFSAPAVSRFYDIPLLTSVTRWVGLRLIINAFGSIQGVLLSIRIDFKSRAKVRMFTSIAVGLVGIVLAKKGFGVWVLVAQQLLDSVIGAAMLWLIVKWRPLFVFSWKSFKELGAFGVRILATGLIGTIYGNLYSLVIGKISSSADLGQYSKANSLAVFPANNISGVIMSVMYPVLSSIQDDKERLMLYYKKVLSLITFVIFPVTLGMAAVAEPLIRVVLTDKWIQMVPYFRILCIAAVWAPINTININLLFVLGRSDLTLRIDIMKRIIGIVILIITAPLGVIYMCYGQIVSSLFNLYINAYYTERLVGYSVFDELRDVSHSLLLSFFMAVAAYVSLLFFRDGGICSLIVSVCVGAMIYIGTSFFCHYTELTDLLGLFKKVYNKN